VTHDSFASAASDPARMLSSMLMSSNSSSDWTIAAVRAWTGGPRSSHRCGDRQPHRARRRAYETGDGVDDRVFPRHWVDQAEYFAGCTVKLTSVDRVTRRTER